LKIEQLTSKLDDAKADIDDTKQRVQRQFEKEIRGLQTELELSKNKTILDQDDSKKLKQLEDQIQKEKEERQRIEGELKKTLLKLKESESERTKIR